MNQEIEDLKKLVEFWQRKHAEAVAALWADFADRADCEPTER